MKLVGAVICNIYVLKTELSACSPYKKTQEGKKEERNKGRDRQTDSRERERKEGMTEWREGGRKGRRKKIKRY